MSATVSFGGIGSGIDTESIISGLVAAEQVPITTLQSRATQIRSAVSTLSSIGSSLSTLQTNLSALDTQQEVNSLTASSSNSAVTVTASAAASPGAYTVNVANIAVEQRTYSKTFASSTDQLGWTDSLTLQVGSGTAKSIDITSTDNLESIASKISASGLRVQASVFYDGSQYRLQVRGLDTGAANNLTFGGNFAAAGYLDLNGTGSTSDSCKTVQTATDAKLTVDGFSVTRSTNQITGVIPGVTMAITAPTSTPATVQVQSDASAISTKISSVLSSFNVVVSAIHTAAGFGTTTKASNSNLAGDSALRSIERTLQSTAGTPMTGSSSKYTMLADVGISLQKDGTLKLDQTKLTAALQSDPNAVAAMISNRMAALNTVATSVTATGSGALSTRMTMLTDQATKLDDQATAEQDRLDAYETLLRKQFTAMDQSVSASQSLMSQLTKIFG